MLMRPHHSGVGLGVPVDVGVGLGQRHHMRPEPGPGAVLGPATKPQVRGLPRPVPLRHVHGDPVRFTHAIPLIT
jgi:hypothetical protein